MRPPAAAPAPGRAGAQPGGKARHPQPGPRPQAPDPVHRPDHPVERDQPGVGVAQAGDAPVGGEIPAPAREGRPRLGGGHVGVEIPPPPGRAPGAHADLVQRRQQRAQGFRARLGEGEEDQPVSVRNDHAPFWPGPAQQRVNRGYPAKRKSSALRSAIWIPPSRRMRSSPISISTP
ncbi:hypothetical protein ATO5_14960 [Loktanella sp. 22II-4b]|nr:hypothetical protein ATO5_14960 [Loktanella sp. 22II-4b]